MPVIAVLSDIHGNHPALLACLAHAAARGAAEYWFLGDYLGELAYPRHTLDTLDALQKQVPCLFLRGNREDHWLRRSPGKAQYLLLHTENGAWAPEFCSVGYDVGEAVREMEAEGLFDIAPAWSRVTAHCLHRGAPTNAEVLKRAMALCTEREGRCDWPDVPERDLQQALDEFGISW